MEATREPYIDDFDGVAEAPSAPHGFHHASYRSLTVQSWMKIEHSRENPMKAIWGYSVSIIDTFPETPSALPLMTSGYENIAVY